MREELRESIARWRLWGALLAGALAGCSSARTDESFQYSDQELRSAVVGDWRGTGVLLDGDLKYFSLTLEQAPDSKIEVADSLRWLPLTGTMKFDDEGTSRSVSGSANAARQLEPIAINLDAQGDVDFGGLIENGLITDGYLSGVGYAGNITVRRER